MQASRTSWLAACAMALIAAPLCGYAQNSSPTSQTPSQGASPVAPQAGVVDGGAGPCSADFVVTDASGKGIYNVKIEIEVRYGLFGAHHLGLMINTGAQGKARMQGLPFKIKGAPEFKLSYENQNKLLTFDPLSDCQSHHDVIFATK